MPTNVSTSPVILEAQVEAFYYNQSLALSQVQLPIYAHQVTAFIGPSGCGKSTLLRCFNQLNDLITGARLEGSVSFHDRNIYDTLIDVVALRDTLASLGFI